MTVISVSARDFRFYNFSLRGRDKSPEFNYL